MTLERRTKDIEVHQTSISMADTPLADIDYGADMVLRVKVLCPSHCNLEGGKVTVTDGEGTIVRQIQLVSFDGVANETDEVVVKAPVKPGRYTWKAGFAAQELGGLLHGESSTSFSFSVKAHGTTLLVWDLPSLIAYNAVFKLKVGVRCSAGCKLNGQEVDLYDQEGTKVATCSLKDLPWPDTGAVYWAEVVAKAPGTEGFYTWTVKFSPSHPEFPHEGTSCTFSFRTAKPPEHVVTVKVIDKESKTPIENAHVVLHPYRACTDKHGVARLSVPKGKYELDVLMQDYKAFRSTADIAGDAKIEAELLFWPMGRQ